ncbi:MAG: apolipoprotein N-acyltransferase [Candidatus Omnitrophica bacterium]|nr:apolipoprotein N-acyltransferase [Candidatus Omnitrophota bacterium]
MSFLSFVALVPLFFALDNKTLASTFRTGYFFGILFFGMIFYWFLFVSGIGMLLLVCALAVYMGIFAVGYHVFSKEKAIVKIFVLPSLWVCIEFLRAHLFSGFGWASIGHSQYQNIALIQIADIVGVYGVSFIVVMVNVAIKEMLTDFQETKKQKIKMWLVVSILFCLCIGYGHYRIKNMTYTDSVKVAVVQGSVPQSRKWYPKEWPAILNDYFKLTQEAASTNPALIIWPETAYPGYVWEDPKQFVDVQNFVKTMKIPLLVGIVTKEQESYYNSAVLIDLNGNLVKKHNKLHLVPFGEYVPLRDSLPWLVDILGIEDFSTGTEYTLFSEYERNDQKNSFGVLICFEDTVPELSRAFVSKGANFLVNITNDGWFEDTKAPFLHMQAAVFRTVENRVPLVRSANTGVSCFINVLGQIKETVQDSAGKMTYVPGVKTAEVKLTKKKALYTKFGDVFTYICFGIILIYCFINGRAIFLAKH